jgi:hypothetical protein
MVSYLELATAGIFTGLGVAIGTTITKLWIEPKLLAWKEKKLHDKLDSLIVFPKKENDMKE